MEKKIDKGWSLYSHNPDPTTHDVIKRLMLYTPLTEKRIVKTTNAEYTFYPEIVGETGERKNGATKRKTLSRQWKTIRVDIKMPTRTLLNCEVSLHPLFQDKFTFAGTYSVHFDFGHHPKYRTSNYPELLYSNYLNPIGKATIAALTHVLTEIRGNKPLPTLKEK